MIEVKENAVCPVCLGKLIKAHLERYVEIQRSQAAGASPAPVDKEVVSWVLTEAFECGMVRYKHQGKSGIASPCGEATEIAIELRERLLKEAQHEYSS